MAKSSPAPKKASPAKKSAATETPARTSSAKTAAGKAPAAQSASAKSASAKAATAKSAPAKSASAKSAPAKSAAAKSAPRTQPAAIVSLKAVFEQLGETHGLPKQQAHALQTDLLTALVSHLKDGARIRMNGFGTLEVRERAARMGRNPATGESMEIKASRKIAFRAAKELKAAV